MRILRQLLLATAVVVTGAAGSVAFAAPCAGFTDVDDTSQFCPNVEWLKNRAITLGCTSATVYCPNDVVSRLAMAAFLNRLANALTPATAGGIGGLSNLDIDTSPVTCVLNSFDVTGAPRLAHGHAVSTVTALPPGNGADVGVQFVESTNNGATYTGVAPVQVSRVEVNEAKTIAAILPPRTLQVGTSYRYGLRISRVAGSTSTSDVGVQCTIRVLFENRNGTSSPFDVASD